VIAIRESYKNGGETYYSLADAFGVTFTAIAKIVTRKTWRHVP
jgi:dephospho-CoA kinase